MSVSQQITCPQNGRPQIMHRAILILSTGPRALFWPIWGGQNPIRGLSKGPLGPFGPIWEGWEPILGQSRGSGAYLGPVRGLWGNFWAYLRGCEPNLGLFRGSRVHFRSQWPISGLSEGVRMPFEHIQVAEGPFYLGLCKVLLPMIWYISSGIKRWLCSQNLSLCPFGHLASFSCLNQLSDNIYRVDLTKSIIGRSKHTEATWRCREPTCLCLGP